MLQTLVLGTVGVLSKAFMSLFSNTRISNPEALQAAFNRPAGQGLITVSNHVAALDDPLVVAALMPTGSLLQPQAYRWGMCATDRCFKNEAMGAFFRAGKVRASVWHICSLGIDVKMVFYRDCKNVKSAFVDSPLLSAHHRTAKNAEHMVEIGDRSTMGSI